jgi:hypothetical protein
VVNATPSRFTPRKDPVPFTVTVTDYIDVLTILMFYLDAGLLARSQYPEGPATGHLGTGFFLGFPVSSSKC